MQFLFDPELVQHPFLFIVSRMQFLFDPELVQNPLLFIGDVAWIPSHLVSSSVLAYLLTTDSC